jgi:rubredoxin
MLSALCGLSEEETKMEKWKCKVCGYIYDPEKGDPDGNIPPNTRFDKLPDSWVCPVCAPKDMFEKD